MTVAHLEPERPPRFQDYPLHLPLRLTRVAGQRLVRVRVGVRARVRVRVRVRVS